MQYTRSSTPYQKLTPKERVRRIGSSSTPRKTCHAAFTKQQHNSQESSSVGKMHKPILTVEDTIFQTGRKFTATADIFPRSTKNFVELLTNNQNRRSDSAIKEMMSIEESQERGEKREPKVIVMVFDEHNVPKTNNWISFYKIEKFKLNSIDNELIRIQEDEF